MNDIDQILPVTEVKKRFLELLKQIQDGGGNIVITKNGSPAGILLNIDEYEGMLDTLEILSDPKTMKALEQSRREVDAGKVFSHEEVWGDDA